ncbi:MAG: iron ABC transporter substrate-binding protein, partial [Muribaculaceae bacterium]|nr:iron ABC transporter substrate-binding protein [Muribaculaceae bacterium]
MKILKSISLVVVAAIVITGCGSHHSSDTSDGGTATITDSLEIISPDYAKGFTVSYHDDMVLLDLNDPENKEAEQFHFALTDKDYSGVIPEGYSRINIPIESAICMTSLQLSNFLKLDIPEKVVGITSTRHLHNEKMNRQIKEGKTHKIGIEGNF